ncbi:hypothetical protein EDEG_00947 [Edhazardia aedis USNM 41457]|uniref:Uncharacterized protein n=1 Tax=Edhazardia aedis (strain USNM 41457) TaxID=1003232 RepID=J9DUA1_EDHAE|nr:hypothetical protein EDEG_00947 [Edhazardia aedis USNM 41457]|eukprot:EJW04877.1 hypothetical protein EDEG_00947 [Edhazardia aedis USNM 41457]
MKVPFENILAHVLILFYIESVKLSQPKKNYTKGLIRILNMSDDEKVFGVRVNNNFRIFDMFHKKQNSNKAQEDSPIKINGQNISIKKLLRLDTADEYEYFDHERKTFLSILTQKLNNISSSQNTKLLSYINTFFYAPNVDLKLLFRKVITAEPLYHDWKNFLYQKYQNICEFPNYFIDLKNSFKYKVLAKTVVLPNKGIFKNTDFIQDKPIVWNDNDIVDSSYPCSNKNIFVGENAIPSKEKYINF